MKSLSALLAALALLLLTTVPASAAAQGCGVGGDLGFHGTKGDGSIAVGGSCGARSTDISGPGGARVVVIDCGFATDANDQTHWNKSCGATGTICPPIPGDPNPPHAFITVLATPGQRIPVAAWCAGGTAPVPSTAALRDEVVRLLVPPPLGVSPSTGTALVNLRTLFWVNTPTVRDLGRSALVGFPVQLRVNYLRTEFDFGDGTSDVLQPGTGTRYDPAADCGDCADYFGHNYTGRGPITVTAHSYWTGQFRVGAGAWVDIPGEVTARQPSTTSFTVKQSRGTLVTRP